MPKNDLTIHCVCKNEPFIYYAIKSVYDFCETILLYDTGSTDEHTLKDIEKLLLEDKEKKITFRQIELGFDEEKWSLDNLPKFIETNAGKMSVGKCRQMQIEETKTKYFMLVDGDEVHHRQAMTDIWHKLLINFPKTIYAVGLPLIWFYDLNHTFTDLTFPYNGRIFVTDKVYMNDVSPNEQHMIKGTNEIFTYEHKNYLKFKSIPAYAHFESVFKPWRRKNKVRKENVKPFLGDYPDVIVEDFYYLERYKKENNIK